MKTLNRIKFDPNIVGGRPTIRGMRVTIGTIVGLVASGHPTEYILELYPYLEAEDIKQAVQYAAWRADELEMPFSEA